MPLTVELADRIAEVLSGNENVQRKRMIGGLAFTVTGHICCGVIGESLMVRVGPEKAPELLKQPHVSTMEFAGRELKGYVRVAPEGMATQASLRKWIALGLRFVASLPSKPA